MKEEVAYMKKALKVFVISVFAVTFASTVNAMPKPVEKVKGWLEKIVKSPLQVPEHLKTEYESATFKPFGLFGGLIKGGSYMVIKGLEGTHDILMSPFELGK